MKKTILSTQESVLRFAPYQKKSFGPTNTQPVEKVTRYGLSTTLDGADCYLNRLKQLKKDGITHLEICFREDFEHEKMLFDAAVKKIHSSGLSVWSIHLPYGQSVNPAEPDNVRRSANVKKIKQFVELSKTSGASVYVIHGSAEPVPEKERCAMLEASVQSLHELTQHLKKDGLFLGVENLPRSCIGNSMEEISYMANKIPDMKLCFDTNHFTPAKPNVNFRFIQRLFPSLRKKRNPLTGNPVTYAEKFADKIITVHISDYDEIDECHWLPGQGSVDFSGIHTALKKAGFDAPILFEPNETCKGVPTTGKRLIKRYEKAVGIH